MTNDQPESGPSPDPVPVATPEVPAARPGWCRRFMGGVARLVVVVSVLLLMALGAALLYFSDLPPAWRPLAACIFLAVSMLLLWFVKPALHAVLVFLVIVTSIGLWWWSIPPSNQRRWQPDVAVLPWADINGDRVVLHNLRYCDYRSEADYTPRYRQRTVQLSDLVAADLEVVHWGSPWIAHTMVSFVFGHGDPVCISIETRKEIGEEYSAIKGFFKQYELFYVMADERDVIRVRTNYRHEEVKLYRLNLPPAIAQKIFLDYLQTMNSLRERPQWYNAAVHNCTSTVRDHALPYVGRRDWDWRFLINGRVDELLYERGSLDRSLPFDELRRKSVINRVAETLPPDDTFSRRIRDGLPGMAPAASTP